MTKRKTREEKEAMKGYNKLLGMTDGKFRTRIVSFARELFRDTRRRMFIESVRIPYRGLKRFKYVVYCVECEKEMGHTEKFRPRNVNGKLAAREVSVYDVDHIGGLPKYKEIKDLSEYFEKLFYSPLQILCYLYIYPGKNLKFEQWVPLFV